MREGEQATASNAAGVPEAIRGEFNRLLGGGSLSDEARKQITDQSTKLYKTYEGKQKVTVAALQPRTCHSQSRPKPASRLTGSTTSRNGCAIKARKTLFPAPC